jgi:hypothetical protein
MNQRGMTLVSAMMSISLGAIALITTFRLVDMAVEVFATLQGTVRAIDTVHEIRFAIGQSRICTLNFNDVTLSGQPVRVTRKLYYPVPTDPSQKSRLEIGAADNIGTVVQISELTLRRDSANTSLAYLDIDMNRNRGPAALPLKRRSIPIVVRTDSANRIICCSSLEVDQCAEDINVYAPPGCGSGYCACGDSVGIDRLACGEPLPGSANAICVARGFSRSSAATTVALAGGETICDANGGNCKTATSACLACERITCEN